MPILESSLGQLMVYSVYISSFSETQQKWSATEKEAFVVYQSVSKVYIMLPSQAIRVILIKRYEMHNVV